MYLSLIDLLVSFVPLPSSQPFFFRTFSSPLAYICSILFAENHLTVIYTLFWERPYIPFLWKIAKEIFFSSSRADIILNSSRTF